MLSWRRVLSILTSRMVVFLTISSSSDSLNFLIATEKAEMFEFEVMEEQFKLTSVACFFVASHKHFAIGSFSNDALELVFLHSFHDFSLLSDYKLLFTCSFFQDLLWINQNVIILIEFTIVNNY